MDWHSMFAQDTPLLEIIVRGSAVYVSLFVLLRVVLKREAGQVAITDILVIVLIADAAQNAMAANYKSITDGVALVAVLVFWAFFLDWLAYRVPWFERLIKPPRLALVRSGRMLRKNMHQELITEDELRSQLRLQGVDDLASVEAAYVEHDGRISVIQAKPDRRSDCGSGAQSE